MMFLAAIATTILVTPVFSAPAILPIIKRAGPTKADSYIVKLKDDVSQASHISQLQGDAGPDNCQITYKYDIIPAYAGTFDQAALDYIRKSPDVDYIQADTIYPIEYFEGDASLAARSSSKHESAITRRASGGEGVTVFGIDTGIRTTHECFGGRATWGKTFGEGYADADGNGHGTHTAGTAVGDKYGVANAANITAVKVCSDAGQCASSDIVAGVNYVCQIAMGPSVATMSLGGGQDKAIDTAVSNCIAKGIHFTIAAGNSNVDAATTSPADVPDANTIGAIDSSDKKASFSNYGPVVDVWALGVNVLSAWIGSDNATNTISGTSMATPQVAGILAVALSEHGQMSPQDLSKALKSNAEPVVTGAPSGTTNLKAQVW